MEDSISCIILWITPQQKLTEQPKGTLTYSLGCEGAGQKGTEHSLSSIP